MLWCHLNKNTQFFCNEKSNLGKKATEDKTTNFSESLSTRPLKVECFIEIARWIKTLRVINDFKKSTSEQEGFLRVLAPIKRSV